MVDGEDVRPFAAAAFDLLRDEAEAVVSGAFHHVVLRNAAAIRIARGPGHRDRSVREWQIATQIQRLPLPVEVPRVLTEVRSQGQLSGYAVTRLPDSGPEPAEWTAVRSSYAQLLAAFADAPTDDIALPPARTWCGGKDFAEIVSTTLRPLLGEDATQAITLSRALSILPRPTTPALVHGDLGPHNIIWKSDAALGLIDWDHACVDDPAIDVAPLIGAYGAANVREIAPSDVVDRAMHHRATLPLQVAAAAHLIGNHALRAHAISNFRTRLRQGKVYDPAGSAPSSQLSVR